MQLMWRLAPLIITALGVAADFSTSIMGLSRGLTESHPLYNPFFALTVFLILVTIISHSVPKKTRWQIPVYAIAFTPYLAAISNLHLLMIV